MGNPYKTERYYIFSTGSLEIGENKLNTTDVHLVLKCKCKVHVKCEPFSSIQTVCNQSPFTSTKTEHKITHFLTKTLLLLIVLN